MGQTGPPCSQGVAGDTKTRRRALPVECFLTYLWQTAHTSTHFYLASSPDVPVESYVLDMRAREGIAQGLAQAHAPHGSKQHPQPHDSAPVERMSAKAVAAAAAAPAGPTDGPQLMAAAAHPPAHGFAGGGDDSCGVSSIGSISGNSSMLTHRTSTTSTLLPTLLSHTNSVTSGSGSMGPGGRGRASPGAHEDDEDDAGGGGGGAGGHSPASARTGISYMPFSEGPRSCVGQSLAKMEVLTVVALLLANFRIRLADEVGGGGCAWASWRRAAVVRVSLRGRGGGYAERYGWLCG